MDFARASYQVLEIDRPENQCVARVLETYEHPTPGDLYFRHLMDATVRDWDSEVDGSQSEPFAMWVDCCPNAEAIRSYLQGNPFPKASHHLMAFLRSNVAPEQRPSVGLCAE